MSTGRFLDAVSALRASAEAAPVDAQRTRGRILSDLRRQRRRRTVMLRGLLPLAAVFAGSTAWAGAAGYLAASWQDVAAALGFDKQVDPAPIATAPPGRSANQPARGVASEPADMPADSPESTAPGAPEVAAPAQGPAAAQPLPAAVPSQSPRMAPDALSPPAAPANPAPSAASDGDALYAEAHRLHFAERNPAGALSAWDAYLRAAPRGRFAVEAHYNRALCLVRLGRTAQAKGALQPFATGAFGGYRQVEAQALLDAMAGAEH